MPVIVASYLNVKDLPNEDTVGSNVEILAVGKPNLPEKSSGEKKLHLRRMSESFDDNRKLFALRRQYDVRMNSLYRILYNNQR